MEHTTFHLSPESLLAERGWIRALALSLLKDAQGADEVVQEAVLAALRRPPDGDRPLGPWLRTVVRNLSWKRVEKDRNRAAAERRRAFDARDASAPSAAEQSERLELERLVVEMLQELEEPFRRVLYLRFFEGLEPREIAARLGAPAGTVRWRLSAGLERLRRRLDERHRGDRGAWSHALLPLLAARPLSTPLATGAAGTAFLSHLSIPMKLALLILPPLVAVALLRNGAEPPPPPAFHASGTDLQAAAPNGDPVAEAAGAVPRREAVAAAGASDPRFSPELLAFAREEFRSAWRAERAEEIPDELLAALSEEWREVVLASADAMGRRRASDWTDYLAAQAVGEVFALLAELDQGRIGCQIELVRDAERFAALFETRFQGGSVDLRTALADPQAHAVDGITWTLPPGVYEVRTLEPLLDAMPRHATLRGAGMDATLLRFGEDLSTDALIDNLAFQDLTIDCNDNYLFDLRRQPASIRFERARVIGFDMGAGGSCMLGTDQLALWAQDSVFEGGYGDSPSSGKTFRVDTPALLARFDRCRFDAVDLVGSIAPNAAVVFSQCTITRALLFGVPRGMYRLTEQSPEVELVACQVDVLPRSTADGRRNEPPAKDRNDLFPEWRERLVR
jgi:RNA polymerase sigma-70 factor (ECF subfamily)